MQRGGKNRVVKPFFNNIHMLLHPRIPLKFLNSLLTFPKSTSISYKPSKIAELKELIHYIYKEGIEL